MDRIAQLTLLAALVGALASLLFAAAKENDEIPPDSEQAEFVEVIDGDTFDVDFDLGRGEDLDRIRMIGIDTPENSYSYGHEPECYGEEATKRSESLLVSADEIWLERDVDPADDNDRLLRYVWYVSEIDGKVHMLNEQLVEEGFALARYYRPNGKYQDRLDKAEDRAISEGRGMWTTCDASVSLDPELEQDRRPDTEPIDRTQVPVDDDEAVCSFVDTWEEALDFYNLFPDLRDALDPDGDDVPCEEYFNIGD
jgi:micrococcal nuclease